MKHIILIIALLTLAACSSQMSLQEARMIADSTCSGNLTDSVFYNENSRTWWIGLDITKEGCTPACVVYENKTAEINWRCTGLLP